MILQETIDRCNSLSIVDVVQAWGVDLKKAGKNHQANCPFHSEKTASFIVSDAKSMYKCFGCGHGGVGAINFVMDLDKVTFFEAVKRLCDRFNIEFETDKKEQTPEQIEKSKKKESMLAAVAAAHRFYVENLDSNFVAQDCLQGRGYELEFAKEYGIGATGGVTLTAWARRNSVSLEVLAEAGIITRKDDGSFVDRFWNRLMFPIRDKYGRVVSFTGRDISIINDDKPPKYLNGEGSLIFKRNDCLLFLAEARTTIRSKKEVVFSEGPFDVLRLHMRGLTNAVGTLGTDISDEQLALVKDVRDALLIGDTDKPGIQSVIKQGKKLTTAGKQVRVLPLLLLGDMTDGERAKYCRFDLEKRDPDDFFRDNSLTLSLQENTENFILLLASIIQTNGGEEEQILDEVAPCLVNLSNSNLELAINRLKIFVNSKKAWTSKIEELKGGNKKTIAVQLNKKEIDVFDKYGFYEADNKYIFKGKNSHVEGSNFVLRPLFHIQGLNSKRMFEMINDVGYKTVIELPQKDMISLQAFNLAVESQGNFLFLAGESELKKLKKFLYETTDSCKEIIQLGWQNDGFYAFSNGVVVKNNFVEADNLGIVKVGESKYYLPAFSDIYKGESRLYVFERQFRHIPGRIEIEEIAKLYEKVYGDNGIISFMFYLSSLYRDVVFYTAKAFPILFLFGAKGTGKTAQAISLLQFFGALSSGPNINSTTKAALADHLGATCNSIQHVEEYRNDIDTEKREMLKGAWDGTGRSRMNMDKDKKKETTHVDCAVMVSGQQMPTADEALFTRVLFLCFTKDTFTDEESKAFNRLRDIEATGLTHITSKLQEHRDAIKSKFQHTYKKVMDEMQASAGTQVQERLIKNWATIQAIYSIILQFEPLPWTVEQTFDVLLKMMLRQSADVSKGNEVGTFWLAVEYMLAERQIEEEIDFVVITVNPGSAKQDEFGLVIDQPKECLIIQHTRILPKYSVFGKSTGENTQKRDTIEYYLKNSPEYISYVKSQSFKVYDNDGNKKRVVRTGFAFDYDMLKKNYNISLRIEKNENEEEEGIGQTLSQTGVQPQGKNLPF
jgi:DNA primase